MAARIDFDCETAVSHEFSQLKHSSSLLDTHSANRGRSCCQQDSSTASKPDANFGHAYLTTRAQLIGHQEYPNRYEELGAKVGEINQLFAK